jgi:hypothetical protein
VGAVGDVVGGGGEEFEVGFVGEGGGLEGVVVALVIEMAGGEAAEFVVNEGDESVSGAGGAAAEFA